MSEPENKTPPEDKNERESVIRILDELVSHMHTSRNVSMVLIISAFILTPMSLIMAVLLLSAPQFVPGHEVHFTGGNFANEPPNMSGNNHMPPPGMNQGNMPPPGPPMFMMEGGPHQQQILDISTMIIVFIVISIVLSSVFLFVGLKEFTFFSKWNKKFSKFMSLRDKIDKELGD